MVVHLRLHCHDAKLVHSRQPTAGVWRYLRVAPCEGGSGGQKVSLAFENQQHCPVNMNVVLPHVATRRSAARRWTRNSLQAHHAAAVSAWPAPTSSRAVGAARERLSVFARSWYLAKWRASEPCDTIDGRLSLRSTQVSSAVPPESRSYDHSVCGLVACEGCRCSIGSRRIGLKLPRDRGARWEALTHAER